MPASVSDSFKREIARMKKGHERRLRDLKAALAKSHALILTDKHHVELVVVSGETHPGPDKFRATTFLVDGPWGHESYPTIDKIIERLAQKSWQSVSAADDDEVIEWTSTPEFIHGSKVVAYIQAANALRYWAGQKGYTSAEYEHAQKVLRDTDAMVDDIEGATRIVERELAAVAPKENPIPNPPWVTKALADAYENVADRVPPAWLPKLSDVKASHNLVSARMREYGCGVYGCVLPTLDPEIVLKITTDDTEAEFAEQLADTLVSPITVEYHTVLRLASTHKGRNIYLLWRESAEAVGDLEAELGREAINLIDIQHAAATDVLKLIKAGGSMQQISSAVSVWLDTCQAMADQDDAPELAPLGRGMMSVFMQQRIFFGDVHAGNVGRVMRDSQWKWVITDPGNVIVFGRA